MRIAQVLSYYDAMGRGMVMDETGRSGLPLTLSAFVGRRALLKDLRQRLTVTRMVTLTGGPGAGKTRLALEHAQAVRSAYEHGVCVVELAKVSEGDRTLLEQAVLWAVGVPSQAADDPLQTLVAYLRDRRMLLIMDNCEHLVDQVGDLVAVLLRDCPHLRVLATSRTLLALDGEALVVVPPLELPDEDGPLDRDVESVQLLVQRAAAGAPGWRLDERDWPTVRKIVRSTGGLPLGIELLVGQMRSLSVEVVAERLDAAPHQRRMAELIRTSFQLCTPAAQRLLAAASVFTGSFDLDAAERVCAGDALAESEVVDALAELVDKSLVVPSDDRRRYGLLMPIRQFATTLLGESDDGGSGVRARHRDHYKQRAAGYAAGFRGDNEISLLREVGLDMPDLRTALSSVLKDPDSASQGLQMAVALSRSRWWTYSGKLPEQSLWLRRALQAAPVDRSGLRASAIALDAWMKLCLGEGRDAVLARIADAEAVAPHDEPVAALLFIRGAQVLLIDGDRHGMDLLRESHRLWVSYGPGALVDAHLTEILLTMGSVLLGEAAEGRAAAAAFVAECERLGAEWGMAWARWCLAVSLVRFDDDPLAAVDVLLDSVRGQREIGDRWTILFTLPVLAWALARAGREYARDAARLLGAADALHEATGIQLSRRLEVFAALREHAETAVCEHLSDDEYNAAHTAQVGTVEDAYTLVLDGGLRALAERELRRMSGGRAPMPVAATHVVDRDTGGHRPRPGGDAGTPGAVVPPAPFTTFEWQLALLVSEGLQNKQIAERQFKSHRTVEHQLSILYRKIDVANRIGLIAYLNEHHRDLIGR
ncbi:LuxR C-terminal-related transcriptional regulator [Saccharothrix sp. Mg75]|uniref:LuxR C-terminal-related transcriptional regulator n=1 Tax=Saccharothrix sp. Mg75 TaxID=3445357 RepID=UPI003EEC8116